MYENFFSMIHTPFSRGIATDALYRTHQNEEVLSRLMLDHIKSDNLSA